MIGAHYDISQDHRTLQISSALEFAAHMFVHESQLGSNKAELREVLPVRPDWVPDKVILFDGHISILYRSQELLGPRWWVEFIGVPGPPLIEGEQAKLKLNNSSGQFVEFERSGAWVEMRLYDHGNVRKRPNLPFQEFVIEWVLAGLRTLRVSAELAGRTERMRLAAYRSSRGFVNMSWQSHVPKALLDYTVRAPLGEVLSNPVPQLD